MGIDGKVDSRPAFDLAFEEAHQVLEIHGGEFRIQDQAARLLLLLDHALEGIDFILSGRLHPEYNASVHLQESPIGIPGKPRIAGSQGQPLDRAVVQSQVQDRVHHAGHRGPGP